MSDFKIFFWISIFILIILTLIGLLFPRNTIIYGNPFTADKFFELENRIQRLENERR
jgi:hypothetical protein